MVKTIEPSTIPEFGGLLATFLGALAGTDPNLVLASYLKALDLVDASKGPGQFRPVILHIMAAAGDLRRATLSSDCTGEMCAALHPHLLAIMTTLQSELARLDRAAPASGEEA